MNPRLLAVQALGEVGLLRALGISARGTQGQRSPPAQPPAPSLSLQQELHTLALGS